MGKGLLGIFFIVAGVMHFVATATFAKIVPPFLPDPRLLVQISGVFEILGGIGVVVPATQRFAAWGLVALLIAVFPANIFMAIHHAQWPGIPVWALWTRVPLQIPLILWAMVYTRRGAV